MIEFDANFAMLIWRDVPASVDKAKERVAHLVRQLHEKQERILISTPVLTEILVHAGTAGPQYLLELTKSARFRVAPFDTRAAVEVSVVMREAITRKQKKDGSKGTWAKVNFDRQIAAIGKVEQAHTLYTDDEDLGKFALKMGLKVVTLAELEIPPSKTPLFDGVPDIDVVPVPPPPSEEGLDNVKNPTSKNYKLQADPAYPPTVQGGNGGRAEGEAVTENKETQEG